MAASIAPLLVGLRVHSHSLKSQPYSVSEVKMHRKAFEQRQQSLQLGDAIGKLARSMRFSKIYFGRWVF